MLLFAGWMFGLSISSFVEEVTHFIGFIILLYVGSSMTYSAFRENEEQVNLTNLRKLFLAAFATSIDAFAVGTSLAMSDIDKDSATLLVLFVFMITALVAEIGITFGSFIGLKFGKPAKIIGGIVLIGIGINLLF